LRGDHRVDVADLLDALRARPASEPPLLAILAALRTLAGPEGGLRARLGLVRVLLTWEQGIADTLLARRGLDPGQACDPDRLAAVVTACAATSALRSSVQIYRSRYPGTGLETRDLLPIIEQAFAVPDGGCQVPQPGDP
jgi:hypothetical protein